MTTVADYRPDHPLAADSPDCFSLCLPREIPSSRRSRLFRAGKKVLWILLSWTSVSGALAYPQTTVAPQTGASLSLGKEEAVPAAIRQSNPTSIEDLKAMEQHVERIVSQVTPSVVAVQVGQGAGSGVVVSADGLVLCAAHVCVQPGRHVRFTFPDGKVAHGLTLGLNHEMDSSMMKITDKGPWPFVDVGDRSSLKTGEWVLALGHPGGFDPERSVVARLGRIIRNGGMLQTDCTLIGGDSGGPLFDMRGRVIGIHSRISAATTENFHVSIATYLEGWERLVKGEEWGEMNATIGVKATTAPEGCRLEQVLENGPGYKAGLLPGDIIMRVDGEDVRDAESLVNCVRSAKAGNDIFIRVKRAGTELSFKVKTEALPIRRWPRRAEPGP